jgi:hypothetical protein
MSWQIPQDIRTDWSVIRRLGKREVSAFNVELARLSHSLSEKPGSANKFIRNKNLRSGIAGTVSGYT